MKPDDISVGMLVTVLRCIDHVFNGYEVKEIPSRMGCGTPYMVVAVQYPYVALRSMCGNVVKYDLRRAELMRISKEYAGAFVGDEEQPRTMSGMLSSFFSKEAEDE